MGDLLRSERSDALALSDALHRTPVELVRELGPRASRGVLDPLFSGAEDVVGVGRSGRRLLAAWEDA